jgi:hypothetical protein
VQLAGAAPAGAVAGIQKVTGPLSATDSQPSKSVRATCPVGKRVLGGGGWAFSGPVADADKIGLTELQPVHPAVGQDYYQVTGQEITPNITTNWSLQAFAICADPVSGLHIVSDVSNPRSEGQVFCPVGQVVLGSGGRIDNPANHVKLIMVTPFEAGDRVRVAAAEDALGAGGNWTVTSFAVCAPTPPGYRVVFQRSTSIQSEPEKVAFVSCPPGTRVHGAAAATVLLNFAAPNTGLALQVVYPFNALDQVEAFSVETVPNAGTWDVRAVAICAT